jgi:hypothetical protein
MAKPRAPETRSVSFRMTHAQVKQLALLCDIEETNAATFAANAVSDAITRCLAKLRDAGTPEPDSLAGVGITVTGPPARAPK